MSEEKNLLIGDIREKTAQFFSAAEGNTATGENEGVNQVLARKISTLLAKLFGEYRKLTVLEEKNEPKVKKVKEPKSKKLKKSVEDIDLEDDAEEEFPEEELVESSDEDDAEDIIDEDDEVKSDDEDDAEDIIDEDDEVKSDDEESQTQFKF